MNRWTAPLAAALLLSSAHAAHAQAADSTARPNSLVAGARAFSFGIAESGTGRFGFWKMRSARTALGVEADVQVTHQDRSADDGHGSSTTAGAILGLDLRRYARTDMRVAPFAQFGVDGGYRRTTAQADSLPSYPLNIALGGVRAGVGAEWFPVHEVSVSGVTGLSLVAQRSSFRGDHQTDLTLSTFTTSLTLQIYF